MPLKATEVDSRQAKPFASDRIRRITQPLNRGRLFWYPRGVGTGPVLFRA